MQKPVALGMQLCEQVIVEEGTKNVTLINCFSRRAVRQFPSEAVPFVVFATLTNGHGQMTLEFQVQRLDTLAVTLRRPVPLQFTDPLQQMRLMLRIRTASFPVPGYYEASIVLEGDFLAQQRFLVFQEGSEL